MKIQTLISGLLIGFSGALCGQTTVNATLDFTQPHNISPLIFGYNQDHEDPQGASNFASRRLGGNRMSVFNWENGASNSGHDNAQYPNDNRIPALVGVPWADKDKAGEAYRFFHQENLDAGLTSIITVPLLGYVAADKNGSNLTSPPSSRWDELVYVKPTAFTLTPDLNDGKVYLDESVNFLVQTFGDATTANGVKYIAIGNEPALWDNTHDLIQTTPPNAADYVQKVIAAAKAVKAVDPNVKVIVGEFAGINIYDFGNAPDWGTVGNGYDWFISYLLDELKKASDAEGYDLVDVLSIHNYPQHKIDVNGNFSSSGSFPRLTNTTDDHIRTARMQFARSMWDETYIEPSWLTNAKLGGQSNKILTRIQNSIDTYYPGIGIMIGEYDYGFDTDISHALAVTDLLGVACQKNVEIINRWDLQSYNGETYTNTAYKFFRNTDGNKSTYGDVAVLSDFDNRDKASVWASTDSDDNDLHVIIINKALSANTAFTINYTDPGFTHAFKGLTILDQSSMALSTGTATGITVTDATISCTLPPLTAYHLVISRTGILTPSSGYIEDNLQLYPNPVNDELRISTAGNLEGGNISITTVEGISVLEQPITQNKTQTINCQELPRGVYIVSLKQQEGTYTKKFIKR